MPSLLQSLLSIFLPSPKLLTMETNPVDFILRPTLNLETDHFFFFYKAAVEYSPRALTRFKIKNINVKKSTVGPQHEFLLITVMDTEDHLERHFILERTVNIEVDAVPDDPQKKSVVFDFLRHDLCAKILPAVLKALLPATIPVAAAAIGVAAAAAPALATAVLPLSLASASVTSTSPVTPSLLPQTKEPTIVEKATLNVIHCFDFLTQLNASERISKSLDKPTKDAPADDRWLAGDNIENPHYGTARGARTFEAYNLNLFHLAILADVVHAEHPLYSIFKRNCYWFSNIIYLAARDIDKILATRPNLPHDPENSRIDTDLIYVPYHLYLPEVAGCWMGFKVSVVETILVKHITRCFLKSLDELEIKFAGTKANQSELAANWSELEASRSELEASRSELEASRSELEASRSEVRELKIRYDQLKRLRRLEMLDLQRDQSANILREQAGSSFSPV